MIIIPFVPGILAVLQSLCTLFENAVTCVVPIAHLWLALVNAAAIGAPSGKSAPNKQRALSAAPRARSPIRLC